MSKILFVNACVRPKSRTLDLAKCLLGTIGEKYDEIDVAAGNIAPLDARTLEYREERIRAGDYSDPVFDLAKQFSRAETVVIAAPFWDLSFPAALKIYLENVLVAGLTFTYKKGKSQGLCKAKRLYYVTTSGGNITADFGFSYIKAIAENFFGITDVRLFCAEGLDVNGSDVIGITESVKEKIRKEKDCS